MSEEGEDSPFICSAPRENGMLRCHDVPPYAEGGTDCSAPVGGASGNSCVNWNQYYNVCRPGEHNPHKGAVNFDNIGYAWIAIFQVRSKAQVQLDRTKAACVLFSSLEWWESVVRITFRLTWEGPGKSYLTKKNLLRLDIKSCHHN